MYAYGCTHSEHGGVPRTKMKVTEAGKTLIRRINTCFQLEKKRSPVVAYENITRRVANAVFHGVKNCKRELERYVSGLVKIRCS